MEYRFESLRAFAEECKKIPRNFEHIRNEKEWTGYTFQEALDQSFNGDVGLVSEAETLLSKLETHIELRQPCWVPSMVGSFPCVPDYISGHPENMRSLGSCDIESSPMRIFVCVTSSAGVTHSQLTQRGIAVLAAVMALGAQRPIELWTCTSADGKEGTGKGCTNLMVKISTNPLCLSEACVALASTGFDRNLNLSMENWILGRVSNWSEFGQTEEGIRRMVNASPNDLVIKPTYLTDDDIILNPVKWVKDTLEKFAVNQQET